MLLREQRWRLLWIHQTVRKPCITLNMNTGENKDEREACDDEAAQEMAVSLQAAALMLIVAPCLLDNKLQRLHPPRCHPHRPVMRGAQLPLTMLYS